MKAIQIIFIALLAIIESCKNSTDNVKTLPGEHHSIPYYNSNRSNQNSDPLYVANDDFMEKSTLFWNEHLIQGAFYSDGYLIRYEERKNHYYSNLKDTIISVIDIQSKDSIQFLKSGYDKRIFVQKADIKSTKFPGYFLKVGMKKGHIEKRFSELKTGDRKIIRIGYSEGLGYFSLYFSGDSLTEISYLGYIE